MSDQGELDFDEVVKAAKNHSFSKILLDRKRLEYLLDETKFFKIVEAVQKALQKIDPKHATLDDAGKFVNEWKNFAKKALVGMDQNKK